MKIKSKKKGKVIIEMSVKDLDCLKNIFTYNKEFVTNGLDKNEYDLVNKIIALKSVEKAM